jgi:hypothetical protein
MVPALVQLPGFLLQHSTQCSTVQVPIKELQALLTHDWDQSGVGWIRDCFSMSLGCCSGPLSDGLEQCAVQYKKRQLNSRDL